MKKPFNKFEHNSLYNRQKQVQNSREAIKAYESLRCMVSMDRMQRMDLIAINNRCMMKFNKIKRAEEASKRYHKKTPFLPNMQKLKLELKLSPTPSQVKNRMNHSHVSGSKRELSQEQVYEELIDEYLQRIKQTNKIETLVNQNEMIEAACREIFEKVEERRNKIRLSTISKRRKTEGTERGSVKQPKHSISDYEFQGHMEQINKSKDYGQKLRNLQERMFLRKLRALNNIAKKNR